VHAFSLVGTGATGVAEVTGIGIAGEVYGAGGMLELSAGAVLTGAGGM